MKTVALAFICSLVVGGCSSTNTAPVTESVGSKGEAVTTSLDLISPATCTARGTKLVHCRVGPETLGGIPFTTAVPLRTVLTPQRAGNCATQYPLQLTAAADDGSATTLAYLSATSAVVRRADGNAMANVQLTDTSPWTATAAFDSTCRVALSVSFNELDVDSAAQAQAILASLQQDLANKTVAAENYKNLMLFEQAYVFMKAVAQNFYAQLTNDTMQQLRDAANASNQALVTLITSCDAGLSQTDKMNLLQLYSTLPVLGSSNDWKNADGGLMTLADVIGPTAQAVLNTVDGLVAQHDPDAGTGYDTDYRQAEAAVVAAQAKLTLAMHQLAPWLGTPDGGTAVDGGHQ